MPRNKPSRFPVPAVVAIFLSIIFIQLLLMADRNSATWDEPDHIYAAYLQSTQGDYGVNPEHPPLIKFLGALPLKNLQLKTLPMLDRQYRFQAAVNGRDFLANNDANSILFHVRLATSVITLLLALIVFFAAQQMFSTGAGIIALALIAFDPTLIGHSALMTTDAGQACFMFASIYAFYRYVKAPSIARLTLVGLAVGLALAAKHGCIFLAPMLVVIAIVEVLWLAQPAPGQTAPRRRRLALKYAGALAAIAVIAFGALWASYGFRYAARPDGLHLNPSAAAQFAMVPSQAEGAFLAALNNLHLLPESYLFGMAHILIQAKIFNSFLLGTTYPHPVWFYFPIAMLIKSTLTFLILLAITVWVIASGRLRARREILYLVIPAAIYMFFAMTGGMNIGVRHVLPIYIFLSVLIAGAAIKLVQQNRRWLYAVVLLLVFQAVSVLHSFPAYVSYANEAFGGPAHVHELLSDSSSDWGQQLKAVKRYTDEHHITNCWFAYFGQGVIDYNYYGIPCKTLITADSLYFDGPHDVPPAIDGPVFMSAGVESGFEFGPGALNAYEQFKHLKPNAIIDYGVFVYDGHFDIPLASALSHVQKAGLLLAANKIPEALIEAQQAQALAPDSANTNATLGRALDADGRSGEAIPYYQRALMLAQSVEPEFQKGLVASLTQRLAAASAN
jgi:tetratricopeptide (TPR) repeat protein